VLVLKRFDRFHRAHSEIRLDTVRVSLDQVGAVDHLRHEREVSERRQYMERCSADMSECVKEVNYRKLRRRSMIAVV
jgi:hypothetical protein